MAPRAKPPSHGIINKFPRHQRFSSESLFCVRLPPPPDSFSSAVSFHFSAPNEAIFEGVTLVEVPPRGWLPWPGCGDVGEVARQLLNCTAHEAPACESAASRSARAVITERYVCRAVPLRPGPPPRSDPSDGGAQRCVPAKWPVRRLVGASPDGGLATAARPRRGPTCPAQQTRDRLGAARRPPPSTQRDATRRPPLPSRRMACMHALDTDT